MKKVIPGIIISTLFVYLSIRGTDFSGVLADLRKVSVGYLPFFVLLMLLMQVLRAWRWGLILRPLARLAGLPLFAITSVGFLAITALPMRLGEFVRPYLAARHSAGTLKMSAALGTIFVERLFDGITILALLSLTPFFTVLPPWLVKASFIFLVVNLLLVAGVICAVFRRPQLEGFLKFIIRRLPSAWSEPLGRFLQHFLDGFRIIGDGLRLFQVLFLSILIWLLEVLAIYFLIVAFHFPLTPVAAVVLLVILVIGIAIPTAPGFVGNWHYSCVLGLGLYGIAKTEALTFGIIFHFLATILTVLLGLAFLPLLKFSFTELWQMAKKPLD